jgi:predicted dehydrogenase
MASIAHLGYGYWGRNIARNFSELGCLAAIVDADEKAATAAADILDVRPAALDEVLSDRAIDAVSIASPAEIHFAHAEAALKAGKHVFVEKPLALDTGHAKTLLDLAKRNGLILMVGHLLQYHPVYRRLREMVSGGDLGRLQYLYSNRMSLGKFRREENVLWSFAPHDISMILGLTGERPSDVSAQGAAVFTPGVADMVTTQLGFPSGLRAHIQVSWMHPFKEQRLVVIGEKAMAVFEDSAPEWKDKLRLYRHRIDRSGPVPLPAKAEPEAVPVGRAEPLKEECRHFIDCVDNRRTPRTDGQEGLLVLDVLERAERALRKNIGLDAGRAEGAG